MALCCLIGFFTYPEFVSAFPIEVTDILSRRVTISASPQRIVSLAPSHTEQLFAIGAGDKVVGVTLYDNYPPPVQRLKRVGGYVGKSISVEIIVSLRPDLVLSRGEIQRSVITALERIGIPVVALEPKNFDEVYASIVLLGRLTNRLQQAEQVVADMRRRVARVRHEVAKIPAAQRARVFYKAYDEPLIAAGPSTFIGHVIEMAGGINIFADVKESYPQVSAEEVLRRDPTVILGPAGNGVNVAAIAPPQRPGWRHLSAVKNRRIHMLDDDLVSRPGPRLAAALEIVAKALYPDRFP
ncbi:MAG: cobalamin-binding protein [bacterium]|nr:cobalamin-binding protein [bacterium]